MTTVARFAIAQGERVPFTLTWSPSHEPPPRAVDAIAEVERTERWWRDWTATCNIADGRDRVIRSLITLKALTYSPTGGMVAAPTTSLPELPGGARNWDYRYCWVRDATFTYYALLAAGFREDAERWREWLVRAIAGDPAHMPVVYRVDGERLLPEAEASWLPGYCNSSPVRIGNAASDQLQLDVFGEMVDAMHLARRSGMAADEHAWDLQRALLDHLEAAWTERDEGIWEMRGAPRHFTHSKVMAWVAFDRAIRTVEEFGTEGPIERWRELRQRIHDEVCENAWDPRRGSFTQAYGSKELDASVLRIPLVGFLPADDDRVQSTIRGITTELGRDGFVNRFSDTPGGAEHSADEGAFLPCSFWLADGLALLGRDDEARAVFERAAGVANDVGLLSEEYDPEASRMLGNFPQALTHVSLVNSALTLTRRRARTPPRPSSERRSSPSWPGYRKAMDQLRIAAVTGASGGIGRATAVAFAEHGFHVGLLARGGAGLEGAAKDVENAGQKALVCPTDVADFVQVDAAASRIEQALGPITVWVNDAMTTVFSRFEDIEPDEFKRATEVTFLGQVWGTRAALARMRPRDRGTIVNVGSALAYIGIPLQSPYCAAKFACRGFFESLRAELIHEGSNVRLSMVHMPAINTPQFDWCKTKLDRRPMPVPPIYQPELAARFIVEAALNGRRAKIVGSWNKLLVAGREGGPRARQPVRRVGRLGEPAHRAERFAR